MSRWRLLLPLAVLVPLLVYVAGTLADGSSGPPRPTPVILDQTDRGPATGQNEPEEHDQDRRGDHDGPDDRDADEPDQPVVVTPRPTGIADDEAAGGEDDGDPGDDAGDDAGEPTERDTDD